MTTGNAPSMPTYENHQVIKGGLTIRQHFTAMAMQGILASWASWDTASFPSNESLENIAIKSVAAADALINALNNKP